MNKIILTLNEIYQLDFEIKDLQSQTLSLVTKYWLNILGKKVNEIKSNIEYIRDELVIKYGQTNGIDDNIEIPMEINGEPNPNFKLFYDEFLGFLSTEMEIEYKSFSIEEFEGIKTDKNPEIIFKLIGNG